MNDAIILLACSLFFVSGFCFGSVATPRILARLGRRRDRLQEADRERSA